MASVTQEKISDENFRGKFMEELRFKRTEARPKKTMFGTCKLEKFSYSIRQILFYSSDLAKLF